MNKQVYIIPIECVEHLLDGQGYITDREKAKRIGTKCGQIVSLMDFETIYNGGHSDDWETIILID